MSHVGTHSSERSTRARRLVDEYLRRRAAGETTDEDELLAEHHDLNPELGRELRKLGLIEQARIHVESSSGTHAARSIPPIEAFPGYDVIRELSRGGQGVVYQAVQHGTKRRVAIKVLLEGQFSGRRDRARFEREVEILGELTHPNIVTIHETRSVGPSTYFVMDYVPGKPLDEYVNDAGLGVVETVRLLAKVCDAVNAAHLRGIIHRDLKPSNIRVDDHGEPRVLDFGLARRLTPEGTKDPMGTAVTRSGFFVGSLPWASPEQAGDTANGLDIRTDVYSLGVILYQLLTRRFPYEILCSAHRIMENILHAEPVPPSTFRPQVDDEVEAITLKCLSKDRERRYQGAGELGRDIRRYLAGEPIEAKRDSAAYALRKAMHRYRIRASIALIATVVLIGVTVITSLLYRRAVRAEETAAGEARSALSALGGLHDIFYKGQSAEITDRQLLEGLAQDAVSELEGEPRAQLRLMETIASICEGRAYYDLEVQWRARVLALHRGAAGSDDRDVATGLHELGGASGRARKHDEAKVILTEALELRRRLYGDEHPDVAATTVALAGICLKTGDYDRSMQLFQEALVIHRALAPEGDAETVRCMMEYGVALDNAGSYPEAEVMFREALAITGRLDPGDNLLTASALEALSMVLMSQSRYEEALESALQGLEMDRRLHPEGHRQIGRILFHVGLLHKDMGSYDEAEARIQEALEIVLANTGARGGSRAYGYHSLAKV